MTETRTDEIAAGVYRFSTFVPNVGPAGLTFNQFLVNGEEPLLFHTGPRAMFPSISEALARVIPVASLRWITFGHVESDECGSMNLWLSAAPRSQVAHGQVGVMVSLNDLADRPPRALADGEVLDLGGKRVRHIDTPHVPHGWEAGVMFEESTSTLLCGDLFTHAGNPPPLTSDDILEAARLTEEGFRSSCYTPATAPTVRKLADLHPRTLALMHGSSYNGDARKALLGLADAYDGWLRSAT